jgi:hypothetical protein
VIQCIGNHRQGYMSTVCSHMDEDVLFKNMPFKLDTYVIDKEFQHTDYFIICESLFAFRYVFEKEDYFGTQNYKFVMPPTIFEVKFFVNNFI